MKMTETIKEYSENPERLRQTLSDVTIKMKLLGFMPYFLDDKDSRNVYKITIRRGKKQISFKFGDSIDNTEKGKEPSEYDVLTCVKWDGSILEDFEGFCSDFGYSEDSMKALKLWKRCKKQREKILKLFTFEELADFPS